MKLKNQSTTRTWTIVRIYKNSIRGFNTFTDFDSFLKHVNKFVEKARVVIIVED